MNKPLSPAPTIQGRRPIHSGGVGVKQIGLRKNEKWKIKQKIPNSCNVDVKHRGPIVRRMTVCRRAIYPTTVGGVY